MADFSTPASGAGFARESFFPFKTAIALVLAALADWLFYGHGIGISAVIFEPPSPAARCSSMLQR